MPARKPARAPSRKPSAPRPVRVARTSGVPTPLPSASLPTGQLTDTGARFTAASLTAHANTVLAKLDAHPDFARFGFTAEWADALRAQVAAVEAQVDHTTELRDGTLPSGQALDAAVRDAKAWRRDALTVVSITPSLRDRVPHRATGSSVTKLTAALRALLPLAGARDAANHGGGAEFKTRGQSLLRDLSAASTEHKTALARLSPEQRELNRRKGVLYEELRRLARAARTVAPAEASLFSVSTHLYSHHGHKTAKAPAGGGAAPAKPAQA